MGVSGQHVSGVFLLQCWCPKRYAAKIAYSDNWTAFEEFANCWEYLFSLTTSRAPWFKGPKPFLFGSSQAHFTCTSVSEAFDPLIYKSLSVYCVVFPLYHSKCTTEAQLSKRTLLQDLSRVRYLVSIYRELSSELLYHKSVEIIREE